ncbi:MAG: PDZ domain-containing protein [Cyanobacteria bacterium CYA]|nr:MAG: PDZ domain-containing protein [Cyanobacteria bacterium CYA]
MLVSRVIDGSPAAAAGLQPGDRITSWNGKPVTGPEDWMPLLLEHKPGDTVSIELRTTSDRLPGASTGCQCRAIACGDHRVACAGTRARSSGAGTLDADADRQPPTLRWSHALVSLL